MTEIVRRTMNWHAALDATGSMLWKALWTAIETFLAITTATGFGWGDMNTLETAGTSALAAGATVVLVFARQQAHPDQVIEAEILND